MHWDWLLNNPAIGQRVLLVHGIEVCRLRQPRPGEWQALLRPPGREPIYRACQSFESGQAGCEAWYLRHQAAIDADILRRLEAGKMSGA